MNEKTIDANKVKKILKERGQKHIWFARAVGVIDVTVSVWFKKGRIPIANGKKISKVLGVPLEELLVK